MTGQLSLFDGMPSAKLPAMVMRDYQRKAAEATIEAWKESTSALVVMPTGTGKTILFADMIRRLQPARAMVLAHRGELIFQARDKIQSVTGLSVEIEMADYRAMPGGQVIVSTIQTQCAGDNGGRMRQFDPMEFGLLIIDEGHHATSDTWQRTIAHYRQNPALRVLGVTATPDRADEEALGQVYDVVAYDYEILDAINDGWLVPIKQQMVEVEGLDFADMRTTAGDLNGADLARVMEYEKNLHGIIDPTITIAGDRRTLIFAASVAHAERLCEILNRHKPGRAGWVCGETDKDDRRKWLDDFKSGVLQYMVNVGVLTEGFDAPEVEVIIQARPTKSRSLYAQMIGRATRPLPGVVDGHERDTPDQRKNAIEASRKKSCLVVDFCGNAGRHKLVTSADILGGNYSDEAKERAEQKARKAGVPVDMGAMVAMSEEEIRAEKERERLAAEAKRARLTARARYTATDVSPFDVFGLTPQRERGWDKGKQLSEKQTGLLLKQGINPDGIPYPQAKGLLDEIFRRWSGNLCSFKQAKLLQKHGYPTETSRADASAIIDALAKNNWKRPA